MIPRRARRVGAGFALAVAAGLCAACAHVPDNGPVQDERSVALAPQDNDARVIAVTASAGQSPLDVVRGFLRAADSFDSDHGAARSYLDAPQAWRPDGAVVYDDGAGYALTVVRRAPSAVTVRLQAHELGRLDADGSWRSAAPGRRLVEDYVLTRRPAGWRIAAPPGGGLRVTPRDLARTYRAVTLAFPSSDGARLVPDLRYLPVDLPAVPTALVRLLLRGPSVSLSPVVRTAVPVGTQLVGSSPLVDGVLTVDLSREALGLDGAGTGLLAAQLVRSLGSALGAGLRGVRLLADGSPLRGLPALLPATTGEELDAGRGRGGLLYLDPAGRAVRAPGSPLPGALGRPHPGLTRLVLSPSGVAAGLVGDALVAGSTSALRPVPGLTRPVAPSVDAGGRVWVADLAGRAPRVLVWRNGRLRAVPVVLPPGVLTALQVSPDGSRLAAVAGGSAWVATIGPDLQVRPFVPLTGLLRAVTDLTWADGAELVLLARGITTDPGTGATGEQPGPWLVSADGYRVQAVTVTHPVAATAVAAGPGGTPLLVAVSGRVLRLVGGRSVTLGPGRSPTVG